MKISYKLIKKIHLYACLSTAAVLAMFILTSYVAIHHNWFDHENQSETTTSALEAIPASETDWENLLDKHHIKGRMTREFTNNEENLVREYARAADFTKITVMASQNQVEIIKTTKSNANAFFGIHRTRGYGGPIQYNLYAFLLDILGVSLIIFTITGIIMWFKVLKNNRWAWIIFIAGLVYVGTTVGVLMYG